MGAAVIQRIVTFPHFKLEYLSGDSRRKGLSWSERRVDALIYKDHERADVRSQDIRNYLRRFHQADGHRQFFVFATVVERRRSAARRFDVVMDPFRAAQVRRDPHDEEVAA